MSSRGCDACLPPVRCICTIAIELFPGAAMIAKLLQCSSYSAFPHYAGNLLQCDAIPVQPVVHFYLHSLMDCSFVWLVELTLELPRVNDNLAGEASIMRRNNV